ncbi:toluene 4-monooxygenase protein E [Pyrobaculum arsenaticum DSM 13514]|uniref:Toluene 4-monooxygenase protein E n=2 Tax=Pyrobaculum arsenaticum TaxID=121277 RepID=A4WIC0_PYRAR|nr:toluene 4-monooxygenase protein E [Pyrobaculum arsenaticum DSM 13514]
MVFRAMSWDEVYKRIFAKASMTEKFFRDREYAGYKRTWITWPMLERKIGRRRPSEYQVVSYALSYWSPDPNSPTYRYLGAPFELSPTHHIQKWYIYFRDKSPLVKAVVEAGGWHDYSDPHEIVYWKYNAMMDEEETVVDGLLEQIVKTKHDTMLSEDMLKFYRDYYDPLRFIWHALQMHCAYLGQMAPTSTVINIFTFMAMDYLRRAQRVAQRIKMLDIVYPGYGFGAYGRQKWEEDPAYQPLRQAVEQMLVAYDYTEALVSFALAIKPAADIALLEYYGRLADLNGDKYLYQIHLSFLKDSQRHQDQLVALFKYAFERAPSTKDIVRSQLGRWRNAAEASVRGLRPVFESMPVKIPVDEVVDSVKAKFRELDSAIGL